MTTWAEPCAVAILQVDDSQRFSMDALTYDHQVRTIVFLLVPLALWVHVHGV